MTLASRLPFLARKATRFFAPRSRSRARTWKDAVTGAPAGALISSRSSRLVCRMLSPVAWKSQVVQYDHGGVPVAGLLQDGDESVGRVGRVAVALT